MQTFLPVPDFRMTAASLDKQRLGKQRSEGYQILEILIGVRAGPNHPVIAQWRGHEYQLAMYISAICTEWRCRGCLDNVESRAYQLLERHDIMPTSTEPPWLGDNEYHRSHRSRLLFKGRKDALAIAVKEMLRAEGIRLANGRRACVEGWLLEDGLPAMRDAQLEDIVELEERVRSLGYAIPHNYYRAFDWDVNDRDEIPYVWPGRLTTA